MKFLTAQIQNATDIAQLVNGAYRGDTSRLGWTTEADILDGLRTSAEEVKQLITTENTLILLCFDGAELIGSVCLERDLHTAHIGMFVVKPTLQNSGIGKALLAAAEQMAQEKWAVTTFQMHVISIRHALIAFYERRGYQRTGELSDFPINPAVWKPKLANLQLITLEKSSKLAKA